MGRGGIQSSEGKVFAEPLTGLWLWGEQVPLLKAGLGMISQLRDAAPKCEQLSWQTANSREGQDGADVVSDSTQHQFGRRGRGIRERWVIVTECCRTAKVTDVSLAPVSLHSSEELCFSMPVWWLQEWCKSSFCHHSITGSHPSLARWLWMRKRRGITHHDTMADVSFSLHPGSSASRKCIL